jgi:sec-independent protein translocase protein TatA
MSELVLILVIALVVFGPRKLPEVGKSLGKTINEFRRASAASFGEVAEVTKDIKDIKEEVQQVAKVVVDKPVK